MANETLALFYLKILIVENLIFSVSITSNGTYLPSTTSLTLSNFVAPPGSVGLITHP